MAKTTRKEKEDYIVRVSAKGESLKDMAATLGCTVAYVVKIRKNLGLPKRRIPKLSENYFVRIREMRESGMKIKDIAKIEGKAGPTIHEHLMRAGCECNVGAERNGVYHAKIEQRGILTDQQYFNGKASAINRFDSSDPLIQMIVKRRSDLSVLISRYETLMPRLASKHRNAILLRQKLEDVILAYDKKIEVKAQNGVATTSKGVRMAMAVRDIIVNRGTPMRRGDIFNTLNSNYPDLCPGNIESFRVRLSEHVDLISRVEKGTYWLAGIAIPENVGV
jgi:hypothetical protein